MRCAKKGAKEKGKRGKIPVVPKAGWGKGTSLVGDPRQFMDNENREKGAPGNRPRLAWEEKKKDLNAAQIDRSRM